MKSFLSLCAVWLACSLLMAVDAQGQGFPVPYSHAPSRTYAASPTPGTYAYAPTSACAVIPSYRSTPYGATAWPVMAYPETTSTHLAVVPPQSSHYANYSYPQTLSYPPAQPRYWPASTSEASVLLHNGNMIGGPPIAQPQPHLNAHPPLPPYGYAPMPGEMWTDAYASGYTDSCVPPAPRRFQNWFVGASGLVMTRDRGDHYTFSYGTLAEEDQRTNTRDASMGWSGGFDIRFGRYFNCGRNAVEAVYWGISPDRQSTQTTSADVLGNLNAILNFNQLNYGGISADNFVNVDPAFDGIHRLRREFVFQNVEVNVWQFCATCGGGACDCSRFRFNWLAGIRYFRFDENLLFGADANDTQLTFENDEIYYNIDVENFLIGFQLGHELEYSLSCRCKLDMGVKLGVYGNKISHVSEIGGAQGVATIANGPFAGREFYVSSKKKDVAFLGEARIGLEYCINPCWTATLGYRAFAVTGVALPSEQIYPDLRGINDVEIIDSNGSLILHGGYAGLQYCW